MKHLLIMTFAVTFAIPSWGSQQIGTLTVVQGDVKIFTHPSKSLQEKTAQESGPRALYEGEYYVVQDAKAGDAVEQGNIVRTLPGANARVVFDNGDQYNVGSATAYRVFWDKDSGSTNTKINLMYGKIRGIVAKGGPRSHLTIHTSTATMGVRGTDFFVANGGPNDGTEISILRGKVDVKPNSPKAKVEHVKAGYSAVVETKEAAVKTEAKPEEKKAPLVVEIRSTTKQELVGIKKSFEPKPELRQIASTTPEIEKKVDTLEKKAVETTLNDIKAGDQTLYKQLATSKNKIASVDEINNREVNHLMQAAPEAPAQHKPYRSELEDLENGVYEKYFKTVE